MAPYSIFFVWSPEFSGVSAEPLQINSLGSDVQNHILVICGWIWFCVHPACVRDIGSHSWHANTQICSWICVWIYFHQQIMIHQNLQLILHLQKKIGTSSYTRKSTNGLINVFKCYVSSYHDNNNILYLILINLVTVCLIYETNVRPGVFGVRSISLSWDYLHFFWPGYVSPCCKL